MMERLVTVFSPYVAAMFAAVCTAIAIKHDFIAVTLAVYWGLVSIIWAVQVKTD